MVCMCRSTCGLFVGADGTGLPLMTRLGPSDVLRVTSEPLSPNGIAKMAARRAAELRAMAEQQGGLAAAAERQ